MEISVIASGSNGNCCLVEDKDSSVLIDAGKSSIEIVKRMQRLGKNIENINAILITHSHHDHIAGVGVISRRFNIPVYLKKKTYSEADFKLGNIKKKIFSINKSFKVKNLKIKPVITSHNVDSCGFVIGNFGLFTDTGVVTKQMKAAIPKLKYVLLESNHEIDMLINGHYPPFLKNWILSTQGHLSNIDASSFIQEKGDSLSLALLGHLSANNNSIEMVKKTFETIVKKKNIDYNICSREKESGCWVV